jgi:carboxypeptidase PM20D1
LVTGATDSRHYANLTKNIYRFCPIRVGSDDLKRVHGINERIAVADYAGGVKFYYQLMKNSAQ